MGTPEYNKQWRKDHPNHMKAWYAKNKKKHLKNVNDYYYKHQDKQIKRSRKYRKKNPHYFKK